MTDLLLCHISAGMVCGKKYASYSYGSGFSPLGKRFLLQHQAGEYLVKGFGKRKREKPILCVTVPLSYPLRVAKECPFPNLRGNRSGLVMEDYNRTWKQEKLGDKKSIHT